MEPSVGEKAISEEFSYTLTKYYDGSTKTNQDRLLSILRIDEKHGFYVDFYRSDNAISNDYLYHNIGDSVALYTQDGKVLKQDEVLSYPCVGRITYFRSVDRQPCFHCVRLSVPNGNTVTPDDPPQHKDKKEPHLVSVLFRLVYKEPHYHLYYGTNNHY